MATWLSGFPSGRFNDPHNTLRSSLLSWSEASTVRRILPTSLLFLSAFSALPLASAQDGLQIVQPDPPPQQCGSFTFTWSGGHLPYTDFLIRATNGTTLREPFLEETPFENTTYIWNPVDIEAGTSLFAELKDSGGRKTTTHFFQIDPDDGGCSGMASLTSSTSSSTSSTNDGASVSVTLSTPTQSTSSSPSATSSSPSSSLNRTSSQRLSAGAIAGIAVGLAILIILAAGAFFYLRRRRRVDRGAAAGLFGGAKYHAARKSSGPGIEQPVTFWDANMFVREKAATTQVRDSFISPLVPRPDHGLGLPVIAARGMPSPHSKGDDELVSLVDPGSDSDDSSAFGLTSHRTSPLHVSSFLDTPYLSDLPASATPGRAPDGAEQTATTGDGARGSPHDSRP